MLIHPELGFVDEGFDLTERALYAGALAPFGKASSLPAFAFRSKIFADLEDEGLWTRDWICIGTGSQIAGQGDLLPFTIGHHGIHVQRLPGGGLIGRFNKAQHGGCRFVPLQCQTGIKTKCSFTSCGYSRDRDVIWAAELGEATPAMRQYLGFEPERLLPVRVEGWGPFMFVNLDPEAPSLGQRLETLPGWLVERVAAATRDLGGAWDEYPCNWKLAGQGVLDQALGAAPKPESGDDDGGCAGFVARRAPLDERLAATPAGLKQSLGAKGELTLAWVFPNLVLGLARDHLISAVLQPTATARTLLRIRLLGLGGARNAKCAQKGAALLAPKGAALLEAWRKILAGGAAAGVERQARLQAPLPAPDGRVRSARRLRERSESAYAFQRYLLGRLLAERDYYWATPLLAPRGRTG
jgi:hypothetical protein